MANNMESHEENLERVSLRIAVAVLQFCREILRHQDPLFHAGDLRDYVTATTGINAPASADRVLRDLRQKRQLDYEVVSRRESLYRMLWARPESSEPPEGEPVEPDEGGPVVPSEIVTVQSALAEQETLIEKCAQAVKQNFAEIGSALQHIRDQRLYRGTYKTFEEYCLKRWGWSRRYADYQIQAAEVVGNLRTIVLKPENEAQARPLVGLPPETQREIWNEVVQASPNGKVSEKVVREKVQARAAKQSAPKPKAKPKAKSMLAPKEPEFAFLQRILAQVTARLKEADAIGKRTWNVDVCSKRALVQGLYEVFHEVTLRLREFQAKPNRNGHSVSRREEATHFSPGGEREEIHDPEKEFVVGPIN